jgi:hypothetical protein
MAGAFPAIAAVLILTRLITKTWMPVSPGVTD